MKIKRIVIIGAGKLAHQLVPALYKKSLHVIQIYNRSSTSLISLANSIDCQFTTRLSEIIDDADLYIICIKDDAIKIMANKLVNLLNKKAIIVHTSGVRPISDLECFKNYGLFYPLHSFSIGKAQSFDELPLLTNANTIENRRILADFSRLISNNTYQLDDNQRSYLHLAAVLANNFTNHLLAKAFDILKNQNIDQKILHPIIKEATLKALENNPYHIQSGPAIRKDETTIEKHLSLLNEDQLMRHIYHLMTTSIQSSS